MSFTVVPELISITYEQIKSMYAHIFRFDGSFKAAVYGVYRSVYKDIKLPDLSALEDSIRLKTLLVHILETAQPNPRSFLDAFLPAQTVYHIPSYFYYGMPILPLNKESNPTIDDEEAREAMLREGSKGRCSCCYQYMIQPCKLYPCGASICRYCLDYILNNLKEPVCPICAEHTPIELVTLDITLITAHRTSQLSCYFCPDNAVAPVEYDALKRLVGNEGCHLAAVASPQDGETKAHDTISLSSGTMLNDLTCGTVESNTMAHIDAHKAMTNAERKLFVHRLRIKRLAQTLQDLDERISHQKLFTCLYKGSTLDLSKHIVICNQHYVYLKEKHFFLTDPTLSNNTYLTRLNGDCKAIVQSFLQRVPMASMASTAAVGSAHPACRESPTKIKIPLASTKSASVSTSLRDLVNEQARIAEQYMNMSKSQHIYSNNPLQPKPWRSSSNNSDNLSIRESINQLRTSLQESGRLFRGSQQRISANPHEPYTYTENTVPSRNSIRSACNSPLKSMSSLMQRGSPHHLNIHLATSPMLRSVYLADTSPYTQSQERKQQSQHHSQLQPGEPPLESPRCSTVIPGKFSLPSTNRTTPLSARKPNTTNDSALFSAQMMSVSSVGPMLRSKIVSPCRSVTQMPSQRGSASLPISSTTNSSILKDGLTSQTLDLVSHPNCSHCHALAQRLITVEQQYFQLKENCNASIARLRRDLLKRSSTSYYKDELKRKDNEVLNLKRLLLKLDPSSYSNFSPPIPGTPEPDFKYLQNVHDHTPCMESSQLYDSIQPNFLTPNPFFTSSSQVLPSDRLHSDIFNISCSHQSSTIGTTALVAEYEIARLRTLLNKQTENAADYASLKLKLDQTAAENKRLTLEGDHLRQLLTVKEAYSSELLTILADKDCEIGKLHSSILELHKSVEVRVNNALKGKEMEIDSLKAMLVSKRPNQDLLHIIDSKNKEIDHLNNAIVMNRMGRPYEEEIMRLTTKVSQLEDSLVYQWEQIGSLSI